MHLHLGHFGGQLWSTGPPNQERATHNPLPHSTPPNSPGCPGGGRRGGAKNKTRRARQGEGKGGKIRKQMGTQVARIQHMEEVGQRVRAVRLLAGQHGLLNLHCATELRFSCFFVASQMSLQ